ncbi:MAG: amino acid ABC transporter substrate-binding protein [Proteobacteria bacterium]|nr:amino acid ABC transporter substrate-binding protein [Pseudomonadota bacterium]
MNARSVGTVIVSALVALMVSYLVVSGAGDRVSRPAVAPRAETAYERVIRTGILRCGYSPWPPYFSLDPNSGVLSGLSKDLSDVAAKLMGIKLEYVQITNGQQVQDLNSGKIDAVCGDGPWVISTIKHIDYTRSYMYAAVYIYGRADETRFQTFDDLNRPNVTFTGIDGDLSSDLVESNFSQAKISTMASTTDPSQLMLNVTTGKADVTIIDPLAASLFIKNNHGKLKLLITQPVAVYGAGFSVRKGEASLLNTLNEAVNASINTGAAERVLKKYDPDGSLFLPVATPYRRP